MGRHEKRPEPVREEGAPEWMVTFSDCMTLLLTFFVLLLSFSSFDDVGEFQRMGSIFAEQFSIDIDKSREKESVLIRVTSSEEPKNGSELPTLAECVNKSMKEGQSMNHRSRKIFLIPSDTIFLGKGTVFSAHGKKTLSDMASFLQEMPNRIVISENGQHLGSPIADLGMQRAWAVIDYLSREGDINKKRLSLSASGTVIQEERAMALMKAERVLEVVLLEGGVCN